MDAFLDTLWEYIMAAGQHLGDGMYFLVQHLHFLGPAVIITLLAMFTVGLTKFLDKIIITRRYIELEKAFEDLLKLREKAQKLEDREKGARMARNIDKAELNRIYYDYFFEGLLLGIVRRIIPIFFMFAFIDEYYRPERLQEAFGKAFVLRIPSTSGTPVLIGSVFWFFISLITVYILWAIASRLLRSMKSKEASNLAEPDGEVKS